MSRAGDALERLRREPCAGRSEKPFRLVSSVSPPATSQEVEWAWGGRAIPDDVRDLWSASRSARLFEDTDFGQWGLIVLDPRESRQRTDAELFARPEEFRDDDIVIGTFLGDQELLVVAPSDSGARRVLIALPLDARRDWLGVAEDLARFLDGYIDAGGDKYWEPGNA